MNITIYDIAQKCNVSIATVSRVLNGSTRVSEKTRAKVLQVMKEMGYKPNPFARGLGLDSMKIVGVICTDVADIFYAHAVSLLEDGLRKHHFDVMLSNTGSDTGHNGKYISAMADKHVDAIITIGTPFSSESDIRQLCETSPLWLPRTVGRTSSTSRSSPSTAITISLICTASSAMKRKA